MNLNQLNDYLGRKIVERAQYELSVTRRIQGKKVRRVASGKLKAGLFYKNLGNVIGLGSKEDYGVFIHEGVNGVKKKWGSPFSYTNKMPPTDEIERWIKIKGVRLRKVVVKNGVKVNTFVQNTEKNRKSAAFAIAKGIQNNGIAPIPFFEKAIESVLEKERKAINDAIEGTLDDMFR